MQFARLGSRYTGRGFARLELATKADIARLGWRLETRIAETKADIIKWNVGLLAVMTAVFAAIVRLG